MTTTLKNIITLIAAILMTFTIQAQTKTSNVYTSNKKAQTTKRVRGASSNSKTCTTAYSNKANSNRKNEVVPAKRGQPKHTRNFKEVKEEIKTRINRSNDSSLDRKRRYMRANSIRAQHAKRGNSTVRNRKATVQTRDHRSKRVSNTTRNRKATVQTRDHRSKKANNTPRNRRTTVNTRDHRSKRVSNTTRNRKATVQTRDHRSKIKDVYDGTSNTLVLNRRLKK